MNIVSIGYKCLNLKLFLHGYFGKNIHLPFWFVFKDCLLFYQKEV